MNHFKIQMKKKELGASENEDAPNSFFRYNLLLSSLTIH